MFLQSSILNKVSLILNHSNKYSTSLKHDIKVYNSLTKQKEPLELKNKNVLYWYSCGPTVYNSAHIGHACSYVNFDIIKRILSSYFQINVVNLMNITDIDDKIIKRAIQEKKPFLEVTKYYEKEFLEDIKLLNCSRPEMVLRVTQHVPEIIKFIKKLVDLNLAYATKSGCVYFNTQKFSVKSFFVQNEAQTEVDSKDNKEKLHPFDFALWKARKEEKEPSWESPWGAGRPGWHIECSTLASIAFDKHIDFHSGGKDLLFPHHHNEMVQCCAFHDLDKWASFWLHSGHLHLKNDVKMSKSLSNTISIRELLAKYTSNQFRLFCLLSPYRNDKEFSDEKMIKPINLSNSFSSFLKLCHSYSNEEIQMSRLDLDENEIFSRLNLAKEKIHNALCDDFDTCLAIDELYDLVNFMNKKFKSTGSNSSREVDNLNRHYGCVMSVYNFTKTNFDLFGLDFDEEKLLSTNSNFKVEPIVDASLKFRTLIRNLALDKQNEMPKEVKLEILKHCDQFRSDLNNANVEFKDHKTETIWKIKQ